ncbi:MAG: 2-hydroxychromene-2-carboxylate isomerase [Alphaproteobacteria bacterium]|jgi:2-hydroxychromene-2-carboxylate isomerase|nr:2-hydroxychromene-2-carboxylate isomerase [Alphaproteobacteria bacterium]
MAKSIDFYLALSSPWTYLAGPRFAELVQRNQLEVIWKPYDIMRVFGLTGAKPVKQRPPQIQANRLTELGRWSKFLNMKLNLEPAHFPVNATPAGRMVIAATQAGGDVMGLANGYMSAVWAEERDIGETETLVAIADQHGFEGQGLLAKSEELEVEAAFEKNTEDAIAANVFGSPIWIYQGELFWGQDRLDFVTRAVEGNA